MFKLKLAVIFISLLLVSLAFAADPNPAPAPTDAPAPPKLEHFDPTFPDASLDPCTDFYKYACSKWTTANPIPADQVSCPPEPARSDIPVLRLTLTCRK